MNPSSKCNPNPRHFSTVLEVKTVLIKMGEHLLHLQPADKGSFQSTVVVISSTNAGKQSHLAAYFFVKLRSCGFAEKIQGKVNFYLASTLLVFCSLKRHSSTATCRRTL